MVHSVLILITLPPNAPLETSAPSLVRTALLKKEADVSAPFPTPSATEDAVPPRMSGLPCPIVAFLRLTYQQLYTSALPRAPTRRSTSSRKSSPGSHSGGLLNVDANVNLNLGGSSGLDLGGLLSGLLGSPGTASGGNQSSGSGNDIDIGALVNGLLDSLRISVPIPGGNHSSGLEVDLYVCIGAGVPGTQSLLGTITDLVNSLLSSLLGATLNCNVDSSCSASVAPDTISIDLQVCGLVGDSLGSTLDKTLEKVTSLLNNLLDGVKIVINSSVGGPGCSATPTLSGSSQLLPSPSTPVVIPHPSVSPSSSWTPNGTNLSWLTSILGRVEGILGGLGLSLGDYGLDPGAGLVVGVSVGLGDTLNGADGLVPAVVALVGETLNCLLATNDTIQVDSNPIPSSTTSNLGPGDGIVVDIDLGIVVNATLSNAGAVVDVVLSGVSGVLADLLNLDVLVNVNGGHDCGCNRSGGASAKKRVGASSYL